ncbi:hypothetical protein [Arthrobacter sp. StoSoilB20]|uniref:hypothetical protein n=1 Tax=Arthrobacter sp. StoSoilB20 TaxID=2830995 RepID=UPI001CC35C1C|nr:hypothetical protein [Arthrobacter sp. StoSoilB20]
MGTGINRGQAALVVLMLAILGFFGTQPAFATETEPGPGTGTEQPVDPETPTAPVTPPVVIPPTLEPVPTLKPLDPETPAPVPSPTQPAPVVPPASEPAAPPIVTPVTPVVPSQEVPASVLPTDAGTQGYVVEPGMPADPTTSAPAAPTPTPIPSATKTAAPPAVSADIAGPLKAALAPVAENNPTVQGLTVLVLILLGVAYFRALRSKGVPGSRVNGK